jgi:hypothetical protein
MFAIPSYCIGWQHWILDSSLFSSSNNPNYDCYIYDMLKILELEFEALQHVGITKNIIISYNPCMKQQDGSSGTHARMRASSASLVLTH